MVSRRVFLASCVAIAPGESVLGVADVVSFFGGIWLKDYFIQRSIANEGMEERGMRVQARVAAWVPGCGSG